MNECGGGQLDTNTILSAFALRKLNKLRRSDIVSHADRVNGQVGALLESEQFDQAQIEGSLRNINELYEQ
ncbi:hypothetical protein niasHT_017578 [Heterodera trifolii]|uniref:Uncharacterized protein n=1 Tax=Heterodera trifolii TaxID=157864 RepID=A0ABD2LBK1_9BILA